MPTQQLIGRRGGQVKLLLQVFSQEGSETSDHGDLHAGRQRDAGEHGIGEQVSGHPGDHCVTGSRGERLKWLQGVKEKPKRWCVMPIHTSEMLTDREAAV